MGFVPNPNVSQHTLSFVSADHTVVNTLYYYNKNSAVTSASLADLNSYLYAWAQTHYLPLISSVYSLSQIEGISLESPEAAGHILVAAPNEDGGLGSDVMPGNVTICIGFRTAMRGKSGRGRNFVVGLTKSVVTGNFVNVDHATALLAAYGQLVTSAPEGHYLCVYSRQHNKAEREVGLASEVTAVVLTDRATDSQNRRLAGHGD